MVVQDNLKIVGNCKNVKNEISNCFNLVDKDKYRVHVDNWIAITFCKSAV